MAIKNEDKSLKPALEKALSYYDTRDLPSNWDREELLGLDSEEEDESDVSSNVCLFFRISRGKNVGGGVKNLKPDLS